MLLPDFAKGERSYRWPAAFPDRRRLLFAMQTTENSSFDDARIMAYSPDGGESSVVASGGTSPRYVRTGHVLFARSGNLHAIPFDLKSLSPTGPAKMVLEGILMDPLDGGACFDISEDGTLVVYSRGRHQPQRRHRLGGPEREQRTDPEIRYRWTGRSGSPLTAPGWRSTREGTSGSMIWPSRARSGSPPTRRSTPIRSGRPTGGASPSPPAAPGTWISMSDPRTAPAARRCCMPAPSAFVPCPGARTAKILAFEDMGPATGSDIKLSVFPGRRENVGARIPRDDFQ